MTGVQKLKIKLRVWERDQYVCHYCRSDLRGEYERFLRGISSNLTVDHVIPISKGGPTNFENLTTACFTCNLAKGNQEYASFQPVVTPPVVVVPKVSPPGPAVASVSLWQSVLNYVDSFFDDIRAEIKYNFIKKD